MSFLFPENDLYVSLQQDILTEKIRRVKYTDSEIKQMFLVYLRARIFDKADALKNQFPSMELPVLPVKIINNLPEKTACKNWFRAMD